MLNRFLPAFIATTMLLSCGHAVAAAAQKLTVDISSDCTNYGLQDRVTFNVELKNRSDSPITLYGELGWGELGGLMLRIEKMNGETVHSAALDDDMIIPSTLRDRKHYLTLFQDHFIGLSRSDRVLELFPGPGQYKVWTEYLSPVPAASSLIKHNFWSREIGRLTSGVIVLTIAQASTCGKKGVREH